MNPAFPRRLCLFLAAVSIPVLAIAQSQTTDIRPNANRVMGEDLVAAYKGVTHDGAYNFSRDGEPRRFYIETTGEDGRTSYRENGLQETGDWFIKQDALCFTYDASSMSGGCFRVYNVGNCYYYYSDTIVLRSDELDQDYWTARSVKKGEAPNCEPGLS